MICSFNGLSFSFSFSISYSILFGYRYEIGRELPAFDLFEYIEWFDLESCFEDKLFVTFKSFYFLLNLVLELEEFVLFNSWASRSFAWEFYSCLSFREITLKLGCTLGSYSRLICWSNSSDISDIVYIW